MQKKQLFLSALAMLSCGYINLGTTHPKQDTEKSASVKHKIRCIGCHRDCRVNAKGICCTCSWWNSMKDGIVPANMEIRCCFKPTHYLSCEMFYAKLKPSLIIIPVFVSNEREYAEPRSDFENFIIFVVASCPQHIFFVNNKIIRAKPRKQPHFNELVNPTLQAQLAVIAQEASARCHATPPASPTRSTRTQTSFSSLSEISEIADNHCWP